MRAREVRGNADAVAVAAMCAADDKRQPQLRPVPASSAKDDHAAPARGKGLLRNSTDWRCILWIVKYFALSALAWYYDDAIFASVPLSMVTFAVLSYYSFAGATVVHNTMHCRCFNNRTLEHVWHHVLSLTYGHPVSTFVPGHNLSHHRCLARADFLLCRVFLFLCMRLEGAT